MNFVKVGFEFKGDVKKVIVWISEYGRELYEKGEMDVEIEGKIFYIMREYVIIEEKFLDFFVVEEFDGGRVFVDKIFIREFLVEGLVREFVRRI